MVRDTDADWREVGRAQPFWGVITQDEYRTENLTPGKVEAFYLSGIADVAARAGVSKATASRALSGSGYVSPGTRDRVRAAADALGYVPSTNAVSLATGRTQNIGVVMPYLNRWFFAEVLEGIQQRLLDEGLDLTLYDAKPGTPGRRRIFDDFLARKRFDGLIAVGLDPQHHELEQLTRIGRPIVSVVSASTTRSPPSSTGTGAGPASGAPARSSRVGPAVGVGVGVVAVTVARSAGAGPPEPPSIRPTANTSASAVSTTSERRNQ